MQPFGDQGCFPKPGWSGDQGEPTRKLTIFPEFGVQALEKMGTWDEMRTGSWKGKLGPEDGDSHFFSLNLSLEAWDIKLHSQSMPTWCEVQDIDVLKLICQVSCFSCGEWGFGNACYTGDKTRWVIIANRLKIKRVGEANWCKINCLQFDLEYSFLEVVE